MEDNIQSELSLYGTRHVEHCHAQGELTSPKVKGEVPQGFGVISQTSNHFSINNNLKQWSSFVINYYLFVK